MSKETKELVEKVKRTFEVVKEGAGRLAEDASKFDKGLSEKIRRVEESSQDIIEHINKKTEKR